MKLHKNSHGSGVIGMVIVLLVVAAIGLAGVVVRVNNDSPGHLKDKNVAKNSNLSKAEIRDRFECDRITQDVRQTDVFCADPTFYNNPSGVTIQMYYDHLDCDYRLKNPPPPDSDIYQYYETCKDNNKLDIKRKEFIKDLVQIKSKVDS